MKNTVFWEVKLQSCRSLLTFRRNILSPYAGSTNKPSRQRSKLLAERDSFLMVDLFVYRAYTLKIEAVFSIET
jgi:hypothetical protein